MKRALDFINVSRYTTEIRRSHMEDVNWILCPIYKDKTRNKIRSDTELKNFPLYCPKKQESLISVHDLEITIIKKEPDAKTQSH